MKNALPFLIVAAVAVTGFRAASYTPLTSPAICTIDSASSNYTLELTEDRLNPSDTTSFGVGFRVANGLDGVTFAGISVVTDSLTCAAAILAYAQISYPSNATGRANVLAATDGIFIVRLSPNRYVLNANYLSRFRGIEHFLVDSTFSLVNSNF